MLNIKPLQPLEEYLLSLEVHGVGEMDSTNLKL